ncbi:MAG: Dam family site-specific DNA-(adenine-N6)-methyltransferase, partial [bacterium]|nr:Dam family site-specific DNA-(adenine-N6)-methyltransferase [bacterium]
ILENAAISRNETWIEPFMGSGVVGFNSGAKKALFSDINPHIINFYTAIKKKEIHAEGVKQFLEAEGAELRQGGQGYYNYVRERFNEKGAPLDFLFLSRSCFNGMMRFNRSLKYNVPYGHKQERFSKSYITRIVNQVKSVEEKIMENDWDFSTRNYAETITSAGSNSIIYCDPPYIGRHVDYYDSWGEENEKELHRLLTGSGSRFILSTWHKNRYRENKYVDSIWKECHIVTREHFYHIGGKEKNRNPIIEALIMNF